MARRMAFVICSILFTLLLFGNKGQDFAGNSAVSVDLLAVGNLVVCTVAVQALAPVLFVADMEFVAEYILAMAHVAPLDFVAVEYSAHHFVALVAESAEAFVLVVRIRMAYVLYQRWMCHPFACLACPFS